MYFFFCKDNVLLFKGFEIQNLYFKIWDDLQIVGLALFLKTAWMHCRRLKDIKKQKDYNSQKST